MSETITLNDAMGIIEIESSGTVTKEGIASSIDAVIRIKRERGIDRVLVDTRAQEAMPSVTGIFELFSQFPRDLKVALLVDRDQPTSRDNAFVETVSVNRGARIRTFSSREDALSWLTT